MWLPQCIKDIIASFLIILAVTPVALLTVTPKPVEAQSIFGTSFCDGQDYISGAIGTVVTYVSDTVVNFFTESFGPVLDAAQEWLSAGWESLASLLPESLSSIASVDGIVDAVTGGLEVPVYDDSIAEQVAEGNEPINNSLGILVQKECFLDGVTWFLARYIIESMTSSLVEWIRNDFEGGPQFVTDFNGFMMDVADRAFGDMINNSQFGFLCDAFDFDVRFALTANVFGQADDRVSCRVSEVVTNIQSFYAGNFSEGSWEGWFEMNLDSSSNPYGAYLGLLGELNTVMNKKNEEYKLNLENGDGYNCVLDENDRCITPGSNIADQFNRSLGAQQDQLITADEIDEILGALFQFLVNEIFAEEEGLEGTRFNERVRESRQREAATNQIGRLLGRINEASNDPNLTPAEATQLQNLRQQLTDLRDDISRGRITQSQANGQISAIASQISSIEAALRTRGQQPTADNETPPSNVAPPLPGSPSFDPSGNTIPSVPPNQPTPGTTPPTSGDGLPAPPANPDGGDGGGGGIGGVPPPPPPPPAL